MDGDNVFEYIACFYVNEIYNSVYNMAKQKNPPDFIKIYIQDTHTYINSISAISTKFYDKSIDSLIKYINDKERKYEFIFNSFHMFVAKLITPETFHPKLTQEKAIFYTHGLIVDLVTTLGKVMTHTDDIGRIVKYRNTDNIKHFKQHAKAILAKFRLKTYNGFIDNKPSSGITNDAVLIEELKDEVAKLKKDVSYYKKKVDDLERDLDDREEDIIDLEDKEKDYRKLISMLRVQSRQKSLTKKELNSLPQKTRPTIEVPKIEEIKHSSSENESEESKSSESEESESESEPEQETKPKTKPEPEQEPKQPAVTKRFRSIDKNAFFNE